MKYARRAYAIAQDEIKKRMEALARSVDVEGPRVVVFNPLPYARDAVVEVEMPEGYSLPGGVRDGGKVKFRTNMAGGVIGGISNGMPVICRAAFKPAATVARNQTTVNLDTFETADLHSDNGYDPCPVLRACPLVESMLAIGVLDLLSGRQGL